MKLKFVLTLSTTALLAAGSTDAQIIIVHEAFDGTGAALDSSTAETFDAAITAAGGSNSWVSSDNFFDDGDVAAGVINNSSAHLDLGTYINDTKGTSMGLFELTMTIGSVSGVGNNWLSIGFSELNSPGTNNHFLNRDATGTIILREGGELDMWGGPNGENAIDGPNGNAGARTVTVALDLSTHNGVDDFGSVTWSDSALDEIGSHDYIEDVDFSSIFLSEANGTVTTISNLTLTQVVLPAAVPPVLEISVNDVDPTTYDFEWNSTEGNFYDLVSSTSLTGPIENWPVWEGNLNIPATSPINTLTGVAGGGDQRRFFAIVEKSSVVLFSTDFESGDAGFTTIGDPTDWAFGTPASDNNFGLILTAGNNDSLNCWGTNLGETGVVPSGLITLGITSTLRSPNIDLTGIAGAQLRFSAALDIVAGDALAIVVKDATTDMTLATINPFALQNLSADWADYGPFTLDSGDDTEIYLEFQFTGSDDNFLGIYLDDVVVEVD